MNGEKHSLMSVLWRRKFMIFAVMLGAVFATLLSFHFIPPHYKAQTLILLEQSSSTLETEVAFMQSPAIARKVIDALNLADDPEFNPPKSKTRPVPQDTTSDFKSLEIHAPQLKNLPPELINPETGRIIARFLTRLRVRPIPGSAVLKIEFTSKSPEKAALLANNVANAYMAQKQNSEAKSAEKIEYWLAQRQGYLHQKMENATASTTQYKNENNITAATDNDILIQKITEINRQTIAVKLEKTEVNERLDRLKIAPNTIESPVIKDLKQQETVLSRQYKVLSNRYGAKHPKIIKAQEGLSLLQQQIGQEQQALRISIENQIKTLENRHRTLETEKIFLEKEKNRSSAENRKLDKLLQTENTHKKIYENFLEAQPLHHEQQITENRIISYAAIPFAPFYPDKPLFLSLSVMLSFLIGALLALFLDKTNTAFRSAGDLEKYTGFPCFGLIPYTGKMEKDAIANYVFSSYGGNLAESLRSLRMVMNLRTPKTEEKPKVITMTSSYPGEGKTTLSAWTGQLAARSGTKTIIVDCDLRRPSLHKLFGIKNEKTLADYLTERTELNEIIQTDDPSGLHMIFSTSIPGNALDLISSTRFHMLVTSLRKTYDMVILDAPACLAVSDSRVLAQESDHTFYIVTWDETPREIVNTGVKQFSDMGYKHLSFVLNKVDVQKQARYGYGDVSYYYSPYRHHDKKAA